MDQVEKLRREVRLLRVVVLILCAAAFVPLIEGPRTLGAGPASKTAVFDEVVAKSFTLKSGKGKTIASWGETVDGDSAAFEFYNPKSKGFLEPRINLSLDSENNGGLIFYDRGQRERMRLSFEDNDRAQLLFFNDQDVNTLKVGPYKNGKGAVVSLKDRDGNPRLALTVEDDEDAALEFLNAKEEVRCNLSLSPDGIMALTFYESEKLRAAFDLAENGDPRLELYDRQGKTIFRAPGK